MAVVSLKDLWTQVQAFVARRDNPHAVTAGQANAYTRPEIDALLKNYVPAGFLPFSRFGNNSGGNVDYNYSWKEPNLTVTLNEQAMNIVLGGTAYRMQKPNWVFTAILDKPQYVYLKRDPALGVNSGQLVLLPTPVTDTPTQFYVGQVIWSTGSQGRINLLNVTMIDSYRISADPIGGAIPVSTGLPTEKGQFKWG